jgi:hypothetical protein
MGKLTQCLITYKNKAPLGCSILFSLPSLEEFMKRFMRLYNFLAEFRILNQKTIERILVRLNINASLCDINNGILEIRSRTDENDTRVSQCNQRVVNGSVRVLAENGLNTLFKKNEMRVHDIHMSCENVFAHQSGV